MKPKEEILKEDCLRLFKNSIKKIKDEDLLYRILGVIREIKANYTLGEMKKYDLKGLRGYRFYFKKVSYRIVYFAENINGEIKITFVDFDKREDVYDRIKQFLKKNKYLRNYIKNKGI